jgi:hypothetical protein
MAILLNGFVLIAFFALRTGSLGLTYDAGLYHLQASEWLRNEPVVFGLANLHGRFGFNSSWLANVTLFRTEGVDLNGAMIAGQIILLLTLVFFLKPVVSSSSIVREPLSSSFAVFALLIFLYLVKSNDFVFSTWILTDAPAQLLCVISAYMFIRHDERLKRGDNTAKDQILLWVLVSYAVTIKLSILPMIILPIIATTNEFSLRRNYRTTLVAVGLSSIFLAIWVVRNILISGCVVYPVAFSCIESLPWAIDPKQAIMEKNWIVSWARRPGQFYDENLSSWSWFSGWWLQHVGLTLWTYFISITATTVSMALAIQYKYSKPNTTSQSALLPQSNRAIFNLVLTLFIGIGFWFFTAPDFRFGFSYFLVLALLPGAYILKLVISYLPQYLFRIANGILVLLFVYYSLVLLKYSDQNALWLSASDAIPVVDLKSEKMGSTDVSSPVTGDQCWLAPLPCTPYPNANETVSIRDSRNLQLHRIRY